MARRTNLRRMGGPQAGDATSTGRRFFAEIGQKFGSGRPKVGRRAVSHLGSGRRGAARKGGRSSWWLVLTRTPIWSTYPLTSQRAGEQERAMTLRLKIKNFRALKDVDLPLDDVFCVVGVNGAGKTTLLFALRFLKLYLSRGWEEARTSIGGNLHSHDLAEGEYVVFGVSLERCAWTLRVRSNGTQVAIESNEFRVDGQVPLAMGKFKHGRMRLQLRAMMGMGEDELEDPKTEGLDADAAQQAREMLLAIVKSSMHYDPDLRSLRLNGSKASQNLALHLRSENAFAMLRYWNDRRPERFRLDFVRDGLRAAMPNMFNDLDFESIGDSVFVGIWHHGDESGRPVSEESNGLLSLLVTLTAVAAAEQQAVVAIDEPENGLHPFAINQLVEHVRGWCTNHGVRVLFTSHSPVMLNQFRACPEKVIVVEQGEVHRLDELRSREWLEGLLPGELYENFDFGSPTSKEPEP